jgi:hypothetical protein
VAEQDPERCRGVRQPVRVGAPEHVRGGAHARDLHAHAARFEDVSRVAEEVDARVVEVSDVARLAEGIARLGDVVVPEHGVGAVAGAKPPEAPAERRLPARMSEEIAGHDHEVGVAALGPRDGAREGTRVQPERAEMEVGEMEDPQPVQLGR